MTMEATLDVTGRQPLYVQLYDRLQEKIQDGIYEPGSALPSIKQLAAEYDISIITVENALKKLIDTGVCYRRPKKGTFVAPSPVAAAPAVINPNARQTLVVHAPGAIEDCQMLTLLNHAIHTEAGSAAIDVLHISGDIGKGLQSFYENPGINLRGVLILYCDGLEEISRLAAQHPEVRFVLLNYQFENFESTPDNLYGVFADEFGGGYAITRYLLQQGYRRIGLLTCSVRNINYSLRIAGYRMALEQFGIEFDPELMITEQGSPTRFLRQTGQEEIQHLLDRKMPDAVLGLNDLLVAGAIEYMKRERPDLKIPMAGFDHYLPELSMSYGFPTMAVDLAGMGTLAVRLLRADTIPAVKSFRLPPTLIQR